MRYTSLFALVILLGLAGCAVSATQVDRVAPSTTLADTSPGRLDLQVHVDLGSDLASPARALLTIAVSYQNKLVQFTRDERMSCNGVALTRYTGAFEEQGTVAAFAGQRLTCVYASGQATATLTGMIPTVPVIVSPQNGATVSRSAQTRIRYDPLTHPFSLVALGPTSKAFPSDAAKGATETILDTRSLTAGPGTISLTEEVTPFPFQGTAFHTLSSDVQAGTIITIMWT